MFFIEFIEFKVEEIKLVEIIEVDIIFFFDGIFFVMFIMV